jgi:hypothetical protein
MPYQYLPEERETLIRWDQTPADAEIFTCDPVLIRRLAAQGVAPVRIETTPDGAEFGRAYRIPNRWIKVVRPRPATAAQREHLTTIRQHRKVPLKSL